MTGMMQAMLMTSKKPVPSLSANSYTDSMPNPGPAEASITFNNDGTLTFFSNSGGSVPVAGQWLDGVSTVEAALYELQVVITSGTAYNRAGTTAAGSGTWRDLAAGPWMYGNLRSSLGGKTTTATFTIRRKSDAATMVNPSIVIFAVVS